jgi:peptide/nickel transport system permease protein
VLKFIVGRLLAAGPVLLGVSVPVFLMLRIGPVDPVLLMLGEDADPSTIAEQRVRLGLDEPLPIQYVNWLLGVLHGDLGRSLRTHQPVLEAILTRLPITIELALLSLAIALLIGLPTGFIAATHRNSPLALLTSALTLLGIALPNFFIGLLLILLFSLWLGVLPPSGYVPILQDPTRNVELMVLPATTLGLALAATIARTTRSSVLEVLFLDFVVAARARGLSERALLLGHVARNALFPVVTVVGLQFGALLGGAVLVEVVFALPGIGRLIVDSLFARDFPVVQGAVLLLALIRIVSNFGVDVAHASLDPRAAGR